VTGEHEVRLTCPEVADPRYVRYAWDDDPALSLFGRSGLPAASFEVSL
jgi:sialate O-acetylesterase